MNVIKTNIDGVVIIEPKIFEDKRGYFFFFFYELEFIRYFCIVFFVHDIDSNSLY